MATQYTVKAGDTLNSIAQDAGYKDYKSAGITGYGDNPDQIKPGQVITIGGAPTSQEVPGIGTLTITPKSIPTAPGATGNEDISGAYARAGLTPPPVAPAASASTGYTAPSIAGLPTYKSTADSITKSYNDTLATISDLETQIANATKASPEEQDLQKRLADAQSRLKSFDLGTLSSEEALKGQGRGAIEGSIDTQTTILDRTRALQRLGLAQEADTLTTQLGLAQDERKQQGDYAQTQYSLATKKLDIALGVADKIQGLAQDEQNNARQFLLDTVNFADGKTYDQLSPDTQAAITHAVANSPITLDMVKTALKSGADKAAATAAGNLRSVAGVGVVQIDPNTLKYKVVVPENPTPAPAANVPTFEQYLEQQNIPLPALTQTTIDKVRAEYDSKYGNATVSLGKLTPTNKNDLSQAGLTSAPAAVQSYFLNAPAEFRDQYQRDVASGKVKSGATLDSISTAYTAWYNANKSKTRDWSTLLSQ